MKNTVTALAAALLASVSGVVAQDAKIIRYSGASFFVGNGSVTETFLDGPSSVVNETFVVNVVNASAVICPGVLAMVNPILSDISGFTAARIGFSSNTSAPSVLEDCLMRGIEQALPTAGASLVDSPRGGNYTEIPPIRSNLTQTGDAISSVHPNAGDSFTLDSGETLTVASVQRKGTPTPDVDFGNLNCFMEEMSKQLVQLTDTRGVILHPSGQGSSFAFYASYNSMPHEGMAEKDQDPGQLTSNDFEALLEAAGSILLCGKVVEVTLFFEDSLGKPALFFTLGGAVM